MPSEWQSAPREANRSVESREVTGLHPIRFLAAAMVMWFHLSYWSWAEGSSTTAQIAGGSVSFPRLAPFASFGWVGVEVFFVVSGFIIAYSAEGKSASAFFKSRFLRLYPAVWICASLSLVALAIARQSGLPVKFLRSITLFPLGPWVDGVYWTLGVEMVFYALIFGLLLFRRFDRLPIALSVIGLASSAFWALWMIEHIRGGSTLNTISLNRYAIILLIPHGCFFAIGGMMWLCFFRQVTVWRLSLIAVCVAAGAVAIYSTAYPRSLAGQGAGLGPLAPVAVWLFSLGLVAASVYWNAAITAKIGRFSATRTMGLATYPLYLIHDVIGALIMRLLVQAGVPGGLALTLAMAAAVGLAIFTLGPENRVKRLIAPAIDYAIHGHLFTVARRQASALRRR
jgi:peptidoglycan/LPS O-acetylase OafA/YrhL